MNKKYYVTFPVTGIAGVEVEANSEEEAIELAWQGDVVLEEWDIHSEIVQGNIFRGMQNEIDVQEV